MQPPPRVPTLHPQCASCVLPSPSRQGDGHRRRCCRGPGGSHRRCGGGVSAAHRLRPWHPAIVQLFTYLTVTRASGDRLCCCWVVFVPAQVGYSGRSGGASPAARPSRWQIARLLVCMHHRRCNCKHINQSDLQNDCARWLRNSVKRNGRHRG